MSRRGLKQIRPSNDTLLDRLRRFFELNSKDELWSEHLIDDLKETGERAAKIHPLLRSKYWPYVLRYYELLQTDGYEFLGGLVDKLNELERALAVRESHNNEDKASAEDEEKYRLKRFR